MFFSRKRTKDRRKGDRRLKDPLVQIVDEHQAVIVFEPDGTIIEANPNFCAAMGYEPEEIKGKHHRIFVDEEHTRSEEYGEFWRRLAAGESFPGRYRRIRKDGSDIWIQATYAPARTPDGQIARVIKVAVDVTAEVEAQAMLVEMKEGLRRLKDGDLTFRIAEDQDNEYGELCRLYNEAVRELGQFLGRSREIGHNVADAAQTLQNASEDLSVRTETQAAAVEETAAAVRGLSDDARERAEQVREMESDASRTHDTTRNSREVVVSAIDAMDRLEKNSAEIAKIVSVIDDISFQTSLLALNAGVEAARAGEAGRGFAVVAQEVRALAQRAAESAREIKTLIEGSSEQVAEGVQLVRKTGDELSKILESVNKISESIVDMAAGVTEQAGRLNEIDTALGEIDGVTQHNAAMVNESIETCSTLTSQANDLRDDLSRFQVHRDEPARSLSAA